MLSLSLVAGGWPRKGKEESSLLAEDKQLAELVKLRFFVGLTNNEAAEVLWRFRTDGRTLADLRAHPNWITRRVAAGF